MSRYHDFPEYVPVAERKRKNDQSVAKLKKKNPAITPIIITGRQLAKTWWGKSWNDNLERYSDYANRIDRGRSYVRHGSVLDLQIFKGKISALVQGSRSKPYEIEVTIEPLSKTVWGTMIKDCAGKIDSLQELLNGKFPKALEQLFTAKGSGLFPTPKEIKLHCSCPDYAVMCKHVAAVLYGIGARLDEDPTSFFTLRDVSVEHLISESIKSKSDSLLEKSKTRGRRVIEDSDLADLFGIEIED